MLLGNATGTSGKNLWKLVFSYIIFYGKVKNKQSISYKSRRDVALGDFVKGLFMKQLVDYCQALGGTC